MAVNSLTTGMIVFKILRVLMEYRPTSAERSLGSTRGNIHHVLFIIIESGMVLFAIQLVRVVITSLYTADSDPAENLYGGLDLVIAMHEMLNVIIRPVQIYFVLLITLVCLGHCTNSNFSAGFNETVLR